MISENPEDKSQITEKDNHKTNKTIDEKYDSYGIHNEESIDIARES